MKRIVLLVPILALAACSPPREPVPLMPTDEAAGAAVVRRPLPDASPPVVAAAKPASPAASASLPPIAVPPNTQYVCVADRAGERRQTAIEFSPKVGELCRKHPEMGPCQYERNLCRRSGGRVYADGGTEITLQTEAEYDKKVMRVRFKAN
jgi:hypothetical protein